VKSQASTIHQLRRVTTLMDSPLKTYVQIGFFLIAESLDPSGSTGGDKSNQGF